MAPKMPEPALLHDQTPPRLSYDNTETLDTTSHTRPKSEFDPCANAKICSPFYLYNHDSPRPSESKPRPDINITIQDLEQGLTPVSTTVPTVIREKQGSVDSGKLRNGSWRLDLLKKQSGQCMTKPKTSKWKSLSQQQRLAIKLAFAALLVGLIIGLAVGLTKALGGGVWRTNNSTSDIA